LAILTRTFDILALMIIWLWAYLMKVILSVPDEGYFERTWWRLFWAYLMKVILSVPDEGYFERTLWRFFWAYLMKVILSVPDEGYFERTWWRLFWAYLMIKMSYLMSNHRKNNMKYVVNNDDNFDTSILNWIYERYFFFQI
jgi:hypothetical protein